MQPDDAALVAATKAGDRDAFARIYDRYADRLHGFCYGVLRDADAAADVTHDTFIRAVERLDQLRDPSRLRPWLYAIARHEAFRVLRSRSRTVATEEGFDMPSAEAGPEELTGSAELAALVWAAAEGLDERDRTLMELSLRQELSSAEVALALGVTAGHASVLLNRMRERVGRALGALVLARSGAHRDCPDLARLLAGWDGTFSVQLRKRVARHADDCEDCGAKLRGALNPLALLGMAPAFAAPAALRERVLEDPRLVSHFEPGVQGPPGSGSGGGPGGGGAERWTRSGFPPPFEGDGGRRRVAAVALLVVLLVLGAALAWRGLTGAPGELAATEGAVPEPAPGAGPPAAPGGPGGGADSPPGPAATASAPESAGATEPATRSPAPTDAGTSPTPSGTSAPPATAPPPTTTATPTPTRTGPEPVGPRLALRTTSVDLGATGTSAAVGLANTGDAPLRWVATTSSGALAVARASGTLAAGTGTAVEVTVDRTGLPEGEFSLALALASDGGDGTVDVTGSVERPPVIQRLAAADEVLYPDASRCTPWRTLVTATWSDESPAEAVLHWSGPDGTGSAPMRRQDAGSAVAPLGPFSTTGSVEYWVVVTDDRGNATTSPGELLRVIGC